MKLTWDQIVLVLWCVTCCTSSSPGKEQAKSPIFDHSLSSLDGLQSWEDWLAKRGLHERHFDIGDLPRDTFQNWQEMFNKRGIGYPAGLDNFGVFDNSKFQAWKDWVSKRGGSPFAGLNDFDKSQFQQWSDWVSKRGGSPFAGLNDFDKSQFQQWSDWVSKRGGSPFAGLNDFDKSQFQQWSDWVSKRGGSPFAGLNDFDKSQFQQWSDWVSKRHVDMGVDGFGRGPNSPAGLQNWADFTKRQSFVYPSSGLAISNNAHFQDWRDWAKRMGSENPSAVRNSGLKDRFIKRQLGLGSDKFDSFNHYFRHGLQDWRSTFRNAKRTQDKGDKPLSEK